MRVITERDFKRLKRRAEWCVGSGPFAVVADCGRGLTIQRGPDLRSAQEGKAWIDRMGCGGRCRKNHEIVEIR